MKLRSFLGALSLAFAVIIFIPSQSLAKGSDDKCSSNKGTKGSKGSKGSSDKGSTGSKGSKDSSDNGGCPIGTVPLQNSYCDKGSKGSCDKIKCVPIVPAPVLTGSIEGTVYEDTNNNGLQDNNEIGVANITVEVIDSNGNIISILTDDIGNYSIKNIPQGSATVTVNIATLPPSAILTAGFNPNDVTVIANTTTDAGSDGYLILFS